MPIIPVGGDKHPIGRLTPRGIINETTDLAQIDAWWSEGDWNYAYQPKHLGCVVFDLDLAKPNGVSRAILDLLPATRTVRTPSGGQHLYMQTDEVFGNQKFADNVDIRCGGHGYVLGPGSIVDGKRYEIINPRPPIALPATLRDRLRIKATADKCTLPDPGDDPGAEYVEAAAAWLAGLDHDPGRFAVACALVRNFGLCDETALRLWADSGARIDALSSGESAETKLAHARAHGTGRLGEGIAFGLQMPTAETAVPPLWVPNSLESWLKRVIPPRIKLIGPLNTASRTMLVAETGIGKTMFSFALAGAAATGTAIFSGGGWAAPEPRRVLYIDGEMPLATLQRRVIDLHRRIGDPGGRLILLSMADHRQVPPLDTRAGMAWVDEMISGYRPDLIICDNIQALTAGEMKEADSWRGMLPWMQSITDRGIAQIWVHHANADGSMYGDKTRGWQLDTVISLKRADDALAELSFDLDFRGKHRDKSPENAAEYREGRVKLQGNRWYFEAAAEVSRSKIENVLRTGGTMKTSELAPLLGMSVTALNKHAGEWMPYIRAGSSPRVWEMPAQSAAAS